jgi:hypothetical protein
MDGTSRKKVIQSWFDTVVHEGERGRAHELHVDQIDNSWEQESSWTSAALEAFDLARRIRDGYQSEKQWTVVVEFFLSSETFPLGVTFDNRSEMERAFSDVPPALFLWPDGDESWVRAETYKDRTENLDVKPLNAADFFGEQYKMFRCIFMECIWSGREEYLRAVYLAG